MRTLAASIAVLAAFIGQAATAAQPGSAQASKAKSVRVDRFEFQPGTLAVSKGARVAFSNASGVAHTATDKGAFDTGRIEPGHSVAVRFAQKGTFSYRCKIHPFMHGKIVVG
ncbi:MAG: cupredoxin domain-containing protein [Solirubrobacterales bacterium]